MKDRTSTIMMISALILGHAACARERMSGETTEGATHETTGATEHGTTQGTTLGETGPGTTAPTTTGHGTTGPATTGETTTHGTTTAGTTTIAGTTGAVHCADLDEATCAAHACKAVEARRRDENAMCLENSQFIACLDATECTATATIACRRGTEERWQFPDDCLPADFETCAGAALTDPCR